ncbi:GyrI-like domain-containing protein [Desulfothermobacter acidiphilus]|uniref:GyrI-like domain-containing protein n=1 Tax=Desulfothermobacter acidiphilus TaxID=1938353 RepID=UPI003F8CB1CB
MEMGNDMRVSVSVRELPATKVAYLRRKGDMAILPLAVSELQEWIVAQGLSITGPVILVYLSNPAGMPVPFREWEVQIPVAGEAMVAGEEDRGVKEIPPRQVACVEHRGSYRTIEALLPRFFRSLYEQGYRLEGPAEEEFREPPVGEISFTTPSEVRFPIAFRLQKH